MFRVESFQTIYQHSTPFYNSTQEEIEVIDPAHPLFGRTFSIASITRQPKGPGSILVHYKEQILLRISIAATTLSAPNPYKIRTKLNLSAVDEFLAIAKDCKALCPNNPNTSGKECLTTCNKKSCATSHSSARR